MSAVSAAECCVVTDSGRVVFFGLSQKLENKRTRELSEEELTMLREEVNKYTTEGDLVRRRRREALSHLLECHGPELTLAFRL